MLELLSLLTTTLIRLNEDMNSNVRMTPNSKKCACYVDEHRLQEGLVFQTFAEPFRASSTRNWEVPGGRTTVCTRAACSTTVPVLDLMFPVPAMLPSSRVHSVNWNILTSKGSPSSSPSIIFSEWQVDNPWRKLAFPFPRGMSWTSSISSPKRGSCRSRPLTPRISSPSSVKVPVLSKQQTLTLPLMLTLLGDIQNMPLLRRRPMAKLVPMDSVAGRAGGTTTVIKSRARMRIVCHDNCARN